MKDTVRGTYEELSSPARQNQVNTDIARHIDYILPHCHS